MSNDNATAIKAIVNDWLNAERSEVADNAMQDSLRRIHGTARNSNFGDMAALVGMTRSDSLNDFIQLWNGANTVPSRVTEKVMVSDSDKVTINRVIAELLDTDLVVRLFGMGDDAETIVEDAEHVRTYVTNVAKALNDSAVKFSNKGKGRTGKNRTVQRLFEILGEDGDSIQIHHTFEGTGKVNVTLNRNGKVVIRKGTHNVDKQTTVNSLSAAVSALGGHANGWTYFSYGEQGTLDRIYDAANTATDDADTDDADTDDADTDDADTEDAVEEAVEEAAE